MYFNLRKSFKLKPFIVSLAGLSHGLINTVDCSLEDHDDNEDYTTEETYRLNKRMKDASRICEAYRGTNQIPGMAVAISLNGQTLLEQGYGWFDIEQNIRATSQMRCHVASISKLFTAHLIMKFIMDEKNSGLNFASNIGGFVPQLNPTFEIEWPSLMGRSDYFVSYSTSDGFPLYYLLIHKGGLRHWIMHGEYKDQFDKNYKNMTEAWSKRFSDNERTKNLFKNWPGTVYQYSSLGVDMLGLICEYINPGQTFYDLLTDEIRRLGLNNTYMWKVQRADTQLARGYDVLIENFEDINGRYAGYQNSFTGAFNFSKRKNNYQYYNKRYHDFSGLLPSEGVISTVGDLVKFGNYYLKTYNGDPQCRLLDQELVKIMWSKYADINWNDNDVTKYNGLMWKISRLVVSPKSQKPKTLQICQHGGSAYGYRSDLSVSWVTDKEVVDGDQIKPQPCPWYPEDSSSSSSSSSSDGASTSCAAGLLSCFPFFKRKKSKGKQKQSTRKDNFCTSNSYCKGISIAIIANLGFVKLEKLRGDLLNLFLDDLDVDT